MSYINEYGHPTYEIVKKKESKISDSINSSFKTLYDRYKPKLDESGLMVAVIMEATTYSICVGNDEPDESDGSSPLLVNAILTYQEDGYDEYSQLIYHCEYDGVSCYVLYGPGFKKYKDENKDYDILTLLDDDLKYVIDLPV